MTSSGALGTLPIIWLYVTGHVLSWSAQSNIPDPSFKSFTIIKPRLLHGRTKREISSASTLDGHVPSITVAFQAIGTNFLLDLDLNRELVSRNAPLRYQRNGTMVSDTRALNDDANCYYSGRVRGSDDSFVALSTCDGISGLVSDGTRGALFVSPAGPDGRHFLYREADLVQNRTCGTSGPSGRDHSVTATAARLSGRWKRSAPLRGPYNANRRSRYVELALVVDQQVFNKNGGDLQSTVRRAKQIANIVNSLYMPLNIFVALVGVEVWTEFDKITLSEKGDTTLTNFLHYRREELATALPNDNAQLLTGAVFEGGVVGKALKGPICTYEFSGGVNKYHSEQVSLVATTVAHEMGHNFGMEHDTKDCHCKDDRCIMSPSSSSISPTHWSQCSLNYLAEAFGHGMDYCLRNKPTSLYDSPVCGNGFVEPGEQCDCGMPNDCKNPCCDASTCMLREGAVCATGQCCDLAICRPKRAGVQCRGAEHECDLSEYCTGNSEYCPDDVHKQNGLTCQDGESYCYDGVCRTRDKQCEILWGPSGKNSVDNCYHQNLKGNRLGNCGYDRLNQTFQRCQREDILCGMLHCAHLDGRLGFGLDSAAMISSTFIDIGGKELPCRTAIIDLGLAERDPGLVPNGAPCGHRKMCVEQRCVDVASVTDGLCPDGCGGNGVCNSLGHCHCDRGWAPPNCQSPGNGGSVDSGPALDSSAAVTFVVILFVVFLGLVPAAAIVFCCVYIRRNNISLKDTFQLSAGGPARKPTSASRQKPSKDGSGLELVGRQPAPASRDPTASLTQTEPGSPRDQLASNLVGHFNGFTIRPMKSPEGGEAPPPAEPRRVCEVKPTVVRPPPPPVRPPAHEAPRTTFGSGEGRDAKSEPHRPGAEKPPPPPLPPQGARTTFDMKRAADQAEKPAAATETVVDKRPVAAAAALSSRTTFGMATAAPRRPAGQGKPHDGAPPVETAEPSVARTTFTARGAVQPGDRPPPPSPPPPPPPRPAGVAPPTAASAPVSPTAPLPEATRPLSVVTPLEAIPDARSATLRSDTSRSSTLDSSRSAGSDRNEGPFGSALSRMSGMFRRADKTTSSPEPQRPLHPNQSFKAAKIDRDRLKGLEISAPIPQSVAVPQSAVPLPAAAGAATTSPPPPTSPAGRRVGAASGRPTAPPPLPPSEPSAAADEVYDDCNMEQRPARHPAAGENIYSTIDDPTEREEHLYATPPEEPADGDLLSQIAAELRTKDDALYAAVNKNRPRGPAASQADALYQNVGEEPVETSASSESVSANLSGLPTAKPDGGKRPGYGRKPELPAKAKAAAVASGGRTRAVPPALPRKPDARRPPFKSGN